MFKNVVENFWAYQKYQNPMWYDDIEYINLNSFFLSTGIRDTHEGTKPGTRTAVRTGRRNFRAQSGEKQYQSESSRNYFKTGVK